MYLHWSADLIKKGIYIPNLPNSKPIQPGSDSYYYMDTVASNENLKERMHTRRKTIYELKQHSRDMVKETATAALSNMMLVSTFLFLNVHSNTCAIN